MFDTGVSNGSVWVINIDVAIVIAWNLNHMYK